MGGIFSDLSAAKGERLCLDNGGFQVAGDTAGSVCDWSWVPSPAWPKEIMSLTNGTEAQQFKMGRYFSDHFCRYFSSHFQLAAMITADL